MKAHTSLWEMLANTSMRMVSSIVNFGCTANRNVESGFQKRNVVRLLDDWKSKSKFTADQDYVFAKTTGKRPTTDDSMFRIILKDLNLSSDRIG